MESKQLYVLITLSSLLTAVTCYPTTVPSSPGVCSKMTPGHGPSPQKSQSPYTVDLEKTAVKGGNIIQVTLNGNGKTFKGFYVQARDSAGSQVGTFMPDEGIVKTHSCGGIKNNAAHHSGKDDKNSVVIHWQAPSAYNGQVTFIATFVHDFEHFWTNVASKPVTITKVLNSELNLSSKANLNADSREETTATKTSQESRILNYNPYSSFPPTENENVDIQQFVPSIVKSNLTRSRVIKINRKVPEESKNRIRKSYYIPQPEIVSIVNTENCNNHHHISPSQSPVPEPVSVYATKYKYIRGQTPALVAASHSNVIPPPTRSLSSDVQAGGYHFLDSPNFNQRQHVRPASGPSRTIKFHDDDHYSNQQHSSDTFTYGWSPQKSTFSPSPFGYPEGTRHLYSPSTAPLSHRVIFKDYEPVNTAIVIPNGMKAYDMPRYGYLVYNPQRGPPFYLIPADNEAFENFHLRYARQNA